MEPLKSKVSYGFQSPLAVWLLLVCALVLQSLLPALAQDDSGRPGDGSVPTASSLSGQRGFASLWVNKTAVVAPEAVTRVVGELKKQQVDPEQVLVFIHGFNVPRDRSTAEFEQLASHLQGEFEKSKTKAVYVGIQWESSSESSIFELANIYWEKISVARSVGRGPARELLLAIQKAYPKAHLSVLAHSMGCEVAAAAVVPELSYADQVPFVPTHEPQAPVKLNLLALFGSDLDYDIWSQSGVEASTLTGRLSLLWQTLAPNEADKKDKVLSYRARLRGKAAGSTFPKMTLAQLDAMVGGRRLLVDSEDIPSDHAFGNYYDQSRVSRLVPVMRYLANPKLAKPPYLERLDRILAAPNSQQALLAYLDAPTAGEIFYALWRLERLNCGDARHLTDDTVQKIGRLLKETPQKIWRVAPKSDCQTIRAEQFPTPTQMTRAGAPAWARKR